MTGLVGCLCAYGTSCSLWRRHLPHPICLNAHFQLQGGPSSAREMGKALIHIAELMWSMWYALFWAAPAPSLPSPKPTNSYVVVVCISKPSIEPDCKVQRFKVKLKELPHCVSQFSPSLDLSSVTWSYNICSEVIKLGEDNYIKSSRFKIHLSIDWS